MMVQNIRFVRNLNQDDTVDGQCDINDQMIRYSGFPVEDFLSVQENSATDGARQVRLIIWQQQWKIFPQRQHQTGRQYLHD